jgi:aminodeoxyfutalosine synthase
VRRQASAIEDLKTIAISRLVFDNVPHVKGYWVMLGQDTAAAALNFGASDLDGTIGQEKIAHAALAKSPVGMAEMGMVQHDPRGGQDPGAARRALPRRARVRRRDEPVAAVGAA